jgi:hypothetical protein
MKTKRITGFFNFEKGLWLFTLVLCLFSLNIAFGQIYNHGEIHLDEGAELYIHGNYEHNPGGKIINHGSIFLTGNCNNLSEGSIFSDQKGKMILTGTQQEITGNDPFLGELWLEKDQNLVLNTYLTVEDFLQLNDGSIDLNGQTLILQNSLESSLQWDDGKLLSHEDSGRVKWSNPKENTKYELPFETAANEPVAVSFELLSSTASSIEINTYAVDDENKPLPVGIPEMLVQGYDISQRTVDRFWYIDPAGENVGLELRISDADLAGNDIPGEMNLMLLFYDGDHWTFTSNLESLGDNKFLTTIDQAGWYALGVLILPASQNTTQGLSLFPQPFSEKLNVLLPEKSIGKSSVCIYDLQSKKVFEDLLYLRDARIQVNTGKLLPGKYVLVIENKPSNKVYIQKLIKH